jgi:hypothetical protein
LSSQQGCVLLEILAMSRIVDVHARE